MATDLPIRETYTVASAPSKPPSLIYKYFEKLLGPRPAVEIFGQRKLILIGLLCTGISSALGTGAVIAVITKALDAVGSRNENMLSLVSLGVIVLFTVKYWFTRGQAYYLSKAANYLTAELRMKLFRKLQSLPMTYFNEQRSGAIQSVLTNDVAVYQNAIAATKDSIDGPVKVVAGLVGIFVLQWKLALLSFLAFPFLWFFIEQNKRKMRTAQDEVQLDLSNLTAMMQEALQGTRITKAFSAEEKITKQFQELTEKSLDSQMVAARRMAALRPTVELIGAVALALVVYSSGAMVVSGELSVKNLGGFLFALDAINQGMRNIGSLKQTLAQVESGTDRIYTEVLDVPDAHLDQMHALEPATASGRIEFKNVSFTYPDGTPALRNVSFAIEPGQSLALVGPSGSGKSTIADLMLRFYDPSEGVILFDGIDVRQIRVSWLRGQIGVVPQQTFLFAGPISDNIRLGKPDATEHEIAAAAKAAHADIFIDQMPLKYETLLGERGTRLSGGEMQRVAIARAIVRKPTMLLLDEATSALDAMSEKAVQSALDEIMRARTTLFIAHRLTTASRADRIMVLRKGEVIEIGSNKELMEADGAFAAMVRAFNSGMLDGEV